MIYLAALSYTAQLVCFGYATVSGVEVGSVLGGYAVIGVIPTALLAYLH